MGGQIEKYKFSVVIPIYNAEAFLRETIDSVLKQDIGFLENIQLILVNDGSVDASEQICLMYQQKYPNNIVYLKQENAGVSTARNSGMEYVEGRYVNFLDSDDKWSPNAFSEVYAFFEEHYNEIDLVSCKQEFFEAQSGLHPLSKDKYDSSRVIDILSDFTKVQLHVSASFVKSAVMGETRFDPQMRFGEDALYVSEIILKKHKYGVVKRPTHFYRKRANRTSAIQGREKEYEWYFETPQKFYGRLMDMSEGKWGVVIPYVQYLTCYDMQWRLNDRIKEFMPQEDQKRYLEIVSGLLNRCDDDVILMQKNISGKKKMYLLSIKYGIDTRKQLYYLDGKTYWKNIPVRIKQGQDDETDVEKAEVHPEEEKYLFTVIVYANGEEQLAKTLESLKNQTLPYERQVQVIIQTERKNLLVYAKYLRKNVRICRKVSMRMVKGQLINCIKEGQVWSKNALEEAAKLYLSSGRQLSVLIEEARSAEDAHNYIQKMEYHAEKFEEDNGKYFFVKKNDAALEQLFIVKEKWHHLEILTEILLNEEQIGILETVKLSGIKKALPRCRETYMEKLPELERKLEKMKGIYGSKYKQNLDMILMYQLADSMKEDIDAILGDEEKKVYERWLKNTLMKIDDYLIYRGNMNGVTRVYAFSLKYDRDIRENFLIRNGKLLFENMAIYNMKQSKMISGVKIEEKNECRKIYIKVLAPLLKEKLEFYLAEKDKEYLFEYIGDTEKTSKCMGHIVAREREYVCNVPLGEEVGKLEMMCQYEGIYPVSLGKMI